MLARADGPYVGGQFTLIGGEALPYLAVLSCPCLADLNGDGCIDFFDVGEFLAAYGAGDLSVDFNGDGVLDFFDVGEFLTAFLADCP